MRVLVVEDDIRTRDFIVRGIRQSGHTADEAESGGDGLGLALVEQYDALIVDRMLPGVSGVDLVRALRTQGIETPCIMLTALATVEDKVVGLQAGADDYLVKPFAFSELLARLEALGRRPPLARQAGSLRVADLEIDPAAHRVTRGEKTIELTSYEFRLLAFLMQRAGEVVTRTMLLEALWGFHFDPTTNIVDAHISRLRAKVDRGFDTELIRTVRGVGYAIRAPQ